MKLELVTIAGFVVGYNLLPENKEEKLALDTISRLCLEVDTENENLMRCDSIETHTGGSAIIRLKFVKNEYAPHDIKSLIKLGELKTFELWEDLSKQSYHRCTICGSKNVQRTAFVKPNEGNKFNNFTSDCKETGDCWCEECRKNVELEYVESKSKKK
jgi:hypothetical protein